MASTSPALRPAVSGEAFERFVRLVRRQLGVPTALFSLVGPMPLLDVDGRVIGSLCAIDGRPRRWTDDDLAVLVDLAASCSSELQLRAMRERAARAAEVAAVEWHRTQTMARLDRAMENLDVDTLATIVLARVQPDAVVPGGHALRWTSAGHPPPMLLLVDGSVQVLTSRPDLVVGVDAARPRSDHTAVVPPGSTLLLYTDGLIERRADGRSIHAGTERLAGCLRELAGRPLEELLDELMARLGDGRDDDIAVLAVRGRPRRAPRSPW